MNSKQRIAKKIHFLRVRGSQKEGCTIETSSIGLKSPDIKFPSISTKISTGRDLRIVSKSTPKNNSLTPIHNTPSPHNYTPRMGFNPEMSFKLAAKKNDRARIHRLSDNIQLKNTFNNLTISIKSPETARNSMKFSPKAMEKVHKFAVNLTHSSSSEISSSESKESIALPKKFESPAVWQSGVSSIHSYISENSTLKQSSITNGLSKGATLEEAEESNITSDIQRYNELKFKLISSDPLTDGVKGCVRQWKAGEILGQGGYAQVFKAFDVNTGELFAVKRIFFNPNNRAQTKYISDLEAEVSILRGMKNKHIVRYLGSESIQDNFCIYLEYLPGGSLAKLLYNLGALSEVTVRAYLIQILKGLEYLHGNGVIHRDIKGANILLDSKGIIKLSDFGCSKQYHSIETESGFVTSLKGSLPWMAPEVIKQKGYGRKADIWSVGCVALEMLTAKRPWDVEDNHVFFMMKIACENTIPDIPTGISQAAKDFLLSCFQRDPVNRKSAKELLEHDFLRTLGN
ncbi:hypothetical protein SteCoe_2711 [Stentor coeruleus]|uniref:Protein kinase domain-containing protein n=1 Tax=Stentor coeruleus TaxID=5963 RepID=A0A1R2CZ16_9CILI|nr:hypothetical protein SteCoe_2711 [Stentor coeruleus]